MEHYFVRLDGPRATFPMDMTEEERALMGRHGAYMAQMFAAGKVLSYGPVMAETGAWGFAVLEVADRGEAEELVAGDPTQVAGMNRFTLAPMRLGGAQGSRVSG